MTMFHFRRSWLELPVSRLIKEANEGWNVTEEMDPREAVREACNDYLPLDLRCISKGSPNDYWCSFDKVRNNFHIVPDSDIENCSETLSKVLDQLNSTNYIKMSKRPRGGTSGPWVENHFWITVRPTDEYEYLCSFNRLSCSPSRVIANDLGRAQFLRYSVQRDDINWTRHGGGRFERKMMYPASGDDGECRYDDETGHCVYNAPYAVCGNGEEDLAENAQAIARAFEDFIEFFQSKTQRQGEAE